MKSCIHPWINVPFEIASLLLSKKWLVWSIWLNNKGNPNQAQALLGQSNFDVSNMGTDGQTDQPTNWPTDKVSYRGACSRLKNEKLDIQFQRYNAFVYYFSYIWILVNSDLDVTEIQVIFENLVKVLFLKSFCKHLGGWSLISIRTCKQIQNKSETLNLWTHYEEGGRETAEYALTPCVWLAQNKGG
jgi:hypothetical protein